MKGRVGDSPIIGGGTYANHLVAVSCTGHGEMFIRNVVAFDVAACFEYKNWNLKQTSEFILEKLKKIGGTGGFVAISHTGEFVMPYNSDGMFRGYINSKECNAFVYL